MEVHYQENRRRNSPTNGDRYPRRRRGQPVVTVDILDGQISRQASLVEYQDGAPRYSVNGPFIWFTWNESAGETNTLSFNVAEVDRRLVGQTVP